MASGIRNFRLGLKGKILLVVLCVFACFMALSTFFLYTAYNSTLDKIKLSRAEERTGIIGRGISSQLQSATDTLRLAAKFFPLLGEEGLRESSTAESRFTQYLAEVGNSFHFFDSVSVYDKVGNLLFGKEQRFSRNRLLKELEWFRRVQFDGSIVYGHSFVSKQNSQTQLPVGLSAEYKGRQYFICGLLALENLTDDYLFQNVALEQSAFLLDKNGVVLNSTNAKYKGVRILQSQIDFMNMHSFGARRYVSQKGDEWYFGFYKIPQANLFCVVYLFSDRYDVWRAQLADRTNLIRFVASLAAIMIVICFVFPAIHDLRGLTKYIDKVSGNNFEAAHMDERILRRNDEIGDFARSLENMVRNILELLQKANETTQVKNRFIEKMSHEIRMPLNNIAASCYLAQQNCSDPLLKNYLVQIETTAQNLLKLAANIQDFSKYDMDQCFSSEELFNLQEMLLSIKNLLKNKSAKKKLAYNFSINENVPLYIRSNKERMRRILLNLISNAIKFTDSGYVHVDIACEPYKQGYALVMEILDSGIGMDPGTVRDLFGNAAAKKAESGQTAFNSRGLLIVKAAVDSMGGEIDVQSTRHIGTSVKVTVPVEKGTAEHSADNTVLVLSENNGAFLSVLLAEGDKTVLSALQIMLEQANCKVYVAVNGEDAVSIAEENVLDLAFIDVEMPIMDGFETAKRILSVPEQRNLLIIALADCISFEDKTKCYEAGMADCIDKQLDSKEFYTLLKKWAERVKGKE